MSKVRIKLQSMSIDNLNQVIESIKDIAGKSGVVVAGPIPLPTRKSPCGDGTASFDNFEMRIHKRVLDLPSNDRVLHNIMRLQIPRSVSIKIEMID